MYKIRKILIKGFWGTHQIESDFASDVNIFIGKNGSGKTTFMILLQAVMTFDFELLRETSFDEIVISLMKGKGYRTITVKKIADEIGEYKSITYKIGMKQYKFPISDFSSRHISLRHRRSRLSSKLRNNLNELKNHLSEIVNVAFLSVNRDTQGVFDEFSESHGISRSIIDARLEELMNDLTTYNLKLETDISKLNEGFQKKVLTSMLYSEKFDHVDIKKSIDVNPEGIKDGLIKAYLELNLLTDKIKKSIDVHVSTIELAAKKINQFVDRTNKSVYPNDVTPITLLRRTTHINELSSEMEQSKLVVLEPIKLYLKLLNEFNSGMDFKMSTRGQGGLDILKAGKTLSVTELSSGEKQLIILLTEMLMQKNKESIFFADEPELSLHISWQQKIIPSLCKLNPNSQLIIATHSPEVVGRWSDNVTNMTEILK